MKKLKGLFVALLCTFLVPTVVHAASASISVRTSGQAVVGNTLTTTVNISSGTAMGAWQYVISYDSSKLQLISGQTSVADYTPNASGVYSQTYTLKFKALQSGNASVNVGSYLIYAIDDTQMSVSVSDSSFRIITLAELQASYSKNNNLKGLSIEGYEISPEFNKDTLEYTAKVPSTIDKINIIANVEDSTASVEGAGEKEVKEGTNPFEIVVTAQNGTPKTYKLVVTVEDINPIKVKLDGKDYTVVKRADNIEKKPIGFDETTLKIGEIEVPAFKSKKLGLTLVAVRDKDGKVRMAIYDNGKYSPYNELTSNNLTIYLLELKELKGFKKTSVDINGTKTDGYKFRSGSEFAIVYGKNVETGEENFYVYDTLEKTFQRYNEEQIKALNKQLKNYKYVTYAFGGCLILVFICFIISAISKSKRKKKLKQLELQKTKEISTEEIKEESKKVSKKNKKQEEVIEESKVEEEEEDDYFSDLKPRNKKKKRR